MKSVLAAARLLSRCCNLPLQCVTLVSSRPWKPCDVASLLRLCCPHRSGCGAGGRRREGIRIRSTRHGGDSLFGRSGPCDRIHHRDGAQPSPACRACRRKQSCDTLSNQGLADGVPCADMARGRRQPVAGLRSRRRLPARRLEIALASSAFLRCQRTGRRRSWPFFSCSDGLVRARCRSRTL